MTDGQHWQVWQWPPKIGIDTPINNKVHLVLDARKNLENIYSFLKNASLFSDGMKLWPPKRPASVFSGYEETLTVIWSKRKSNRDAKTQYSLWLDSMRASGMVPEDEADIQEMFIRHCVLVTIARAVTNALLDPDIKQQDKREETLSSGFINWIGQTEDGRQWRDGIQQLTDQYDWRRRPGDVLRTLYQDIIPSEQRKIYGEYYTPDWLAEMLADIVLDPKWLKRSIRKARHAKRNKSIDNELSGIGVLDPTCGSGTFLYHTARRLLNTKALRDSGLSAEEKSDIVVSLLHGIDIHPVAVEFSRATLLRALPAPPSNPDAMLNIWQGDSLLIDWGKGAIQSDLFSSSENTGVFTFRSASKKMRFDIPVAFTKTPTFNQDIRRFVERASLQGDFIDIDDLTKGLSKDDAKTLAKGFDELKEICKNEGNGVWAHYILNTVSPSLLAERGVDRILANPPWVRINEIQVLNRKVAFEKLAKDLNIWPGKQHATAFDIAAAFIIQCGSTYLIGEHTKAAWLTNRAAISAGNWSKYREQVKERNNLTYWIDFSKLREAPFTGAASCAWLQEVDGKNQQMVLINRDNRIKRIDSWSLVQQRTKLEISQSKKSAAPSQYIDNNGKVVFRNGATLFPQSLICVDLSQEISEDDENVTGKTVTGKHNPWNTYGNQKFTVPKSWYVETVFSYDLLPYTLRNKLTRCIIPLDDTGTSFVENPDENEYWRSASDIYEDKRGKGSTTPKTLIKRLNHQGSLLTQLLQPDNEQGMAKRRVVYNGSGQLLRAARASLKQIVEHGCYYFDAESEEEALYLCAIINAEVLQERFSDSRETDRHFDTHPWRKVPIPRFNAKKSNHKHLVKLALDAEKIAAGAINEKGTYGQIKISQEIRMQIAKSDIGKDINRTVSKIVTQ